jgi:hypothetical protein
MYGTLKLIIAYTEGNSTSLLQAGRCKRFTATLKTNSVHNLQYEKLKIYR